MTAPDPSGGAGPDGLAVRTATDADATVARSVLDAAMLDVDGFDDRLAAGDVVVATVEGRVVGAATLRPHYVRSGTHVEAIAVRPRRRGQGIGTALVEAVTDRCPLSAEFDAGVRRFYESLGFSVRPLDGGRCRGMLEDDER